MARLLPLLLATLAALLVLPPAAAGSSADPAERVPEDLPGRVDAFQAGLEEAAEADDAAGLREAVNDSRPLARDLLPLLRDLQGDDRSGALVAQLWSRLEEAARAGNLSDARSLARSAAGTLADDLAPRVERWDANRTAVTVGHAEPGDSGRIVLPLVVLNPPTGGLGALDADLGVDPARARPVDVSLELGRGRTTVDAANGTARAASFQAEALAGIQTTGAPAAVFARVAVDPVDLDPGDRLDVAVDVNAAADASGDTVLVLSPDGTADVPARTQGFLSSVPAGWGGLAAVGLLGAGALVAVRRLEV